MPKLTPHWMGGAPMAPLAEQELFIGLVQASSWSSTSDWFERTGLQHKAVMVAETFPWLHGAMCVYTG